MERPSNPTHVLRYMLFSAAAEQGVEELIQCTYTMFETAERCGKMMASFPEDDRLFPVEMFTLIMHRCIAQQDSMLRTLNNKIEENRNDPEYSESIKRAEQLYGSNESATVLIEAHLNEMRARKDAITKQNHSW